MSAEQLVEHHTSPSAATEPAPGGRCSTCAAERAWFKRMGLGEPPEAARVAERIVEELVMKVAAKG